MRIIKNLLLLTLPLLVILLLVAEFILRTWLPVRDPYERFKHRYSNAYIPSQMPANAVYRLSSRENLRNMDTAITYSTNNVGFRGAFLQMPKPDDELRIFIIGGSTTQCLYIDDEKSLNAIVQKHLQSANGKKARVYAAARSGDATAEHLSMLVHRILFMQPDLVIVFSGFNDLRKSVQQYDYMHLRPVKEYSPRYIYLAATETQLARRLYYLFKKPTDDEKREAVPLVTNYRQLFAIQQRQPVTDSVPLVDARPYATNLRSIAGACRQNRVPLIFMPNQSTWAEPSMLSQHWLLTCGKVRYQEDLLKAGLDVFNDTMRKVAHEENVPIFDLPEAIPPTSEYFYDDCHFTTAGCDTAGRMLASFIVNNNLPDTVLRVSTFKYK